MPSYNPPLRDMQFLMHEVFKLEDEYNRYLQELRGEAYVVFRSGDRAGSDGDAPAAPAPSGG